MKLVRIAAALALLLAASPAAAEKLVFDHRLSPPLKAVFDGGDASKIAYNDKNPRYVTDLIAVRGASAEDWTEALVIIARTPSRKVRTAADWMAELRAEAESRCATVFTPIAEDPQSLTFERRSTGCAADYPPHAIYRVVAGPRSLFLLAAMAKDGLSAEAQRQWRAVLASARLE